MFLFFGLRPASCSICNAHVTQAYGRELAEAADWCKKYESSRKESDLHQAWDLYYHVFKKINKQLPSLTVLELQYVAPALVRAQVTAGSHYTRRDRTWPRFAHFYHRTPQVQSTCIFHAKCPLVLSLPSSLPQLLS